MGCTNTGSPAADHAVSADSGGSDAVGPLSPDGRTRTGAPDVSAEPPPPDRMAPIGAAHGWSAAAGDRATLRGRRAAACLGGELTLFDATDAGLAAIPQAAGGQCTDVLLRDDSLVIAGEDLVTRAWPDGDGPGDAVPLVTHLGGPTRVASSGDRIAAAGEALHIVANGQTTTVALSRPGVALAAAPTRLAVGLADGSLALFDAAGVALHSVSLDANATALDFDGDRLLVCLGAAGLAVVPLAADGALGAPDLHDLGGLALDLAPLEPGLVALAGFRAVNLLATSSGLPVALARERRPAPVADPVSGGFPADPALMVAADGRRLLAGFAHGAVLLDVDPAAAAPDLEPNSRLVTMRDTAVGAAFSFGLVLRNQGNADLHLQPPTLDLGTFVMEELPFADGPVTVAPGDALVLEGQWTPASDSLDVARLDLLSDDPDEPTLAIHLVGRFPHAGVGDAAPRTQALPDGSGRLHSLEETLGKVVLVKLFNFT